MTSRFITRSGVVVSTNTKAAAAVGFEPVAEEPAAKSPAKRAAKSVKKSE